MVITSFPPPLLKPEGKASIEGPGHEERDFKGQGRVGYKVFVSLVTAV